MSERTDHIPAPDELPVLPPDPSEADMAEPGDGGAPPRRGYPRMDVAKKLARQVQFLQHFRRTGVLSEAARLTGVSRNLVHTYWRADPVFEAAFQEALEEAADVVELELYRRGVTGVDEVVIHQGVPTMVQDEDGNERPLTVKKYSDGCLLALAKARRPEKYRENHKVEHQVTGAAGVLVVPAAADAASWEAAAAEQQARFRPATPPEQGRLP